MYNENLTKSSEHSNDKGTLATPLLFNNWGRLRGPSLSSVILPGTPPMDTAGSRSNPCRPTLRHWMPPGSPPDHSSAPFALPSPWGPVTWSVSVALALWLLAGGGHRGQPPEPGETAAGPHSLRNGSPPGAGPQSPACGRLRGESRGCCPTPLLALRSCSVLCFIRSFY